ncbi:MAG: glycosyltransferase family 2 protein [Ignavibacteria bacterium]|nr:glycosyltransferase family 2 protein [Ignavibacteria bacterium]
MNGRFSDIAGLVVLYNPDQNVIENIQSYINKLTMLYVVDNSEVCNIKIAKTIKAFNNSKYIFNGENLGIAKALNIGAEEAIKDGFLFLFTFDQDSKVTPTMIETMLSFLRQNDYSSIGILSPFQDNKGYKKPPNNKFTEVSNIATSGNILNLDAYKQVGSFIDELFIDYVDVEYCLRLNYCGFKVIRLNEAILIHNLGNIVKRRFLFRKVAVTNHSALRLYYKTRNRFYVLRKYKYKFPLFSIYNFFRLFMETLKVVCFERERIEKIRMMIKGYSHYKKKKFGKLILQ